MRTIFLGTPALAVPFLERLHQKTTIASVISTPDQPAGRGYSLKPSDVKLAAQRLSLPILQPESLKSSTVVDQLKALNVDLGLAVAYGKLLPKDVLAIPKHGFLNVHFSLLPKYRGAAPIQWSLVNGETETGVTLFWLDEGMDTGPILIQKKIAVLPEDNADSLRNKLVSLGVIALDEALQQIESGKIVREVQQGVPTKAPILKKEDGQIDWKLPADVLNNKLRGLTPWPGLHVGPLKVLKVAVVSDNAQAVPGTAIRLVNGEGPVVKCGKNALTLLEVQPEGKKPMSAWSWWQGARLKIGDQIG